MANENNTNKDLVTLTPVEKAKLLNLLVTVGYYWLTEDSYNSAISVLFFLRDLKTTKRQKNKILDFENDIRSSMDPAEWEEALQKEEEYLEEMKDAKSSDEKFIFYTFIAIVNIFHYGDTQMGFNFYRETVSVSIPLANAIMEHLKTDGSLQLQVNHYFAYHLCLFADFKGIDVREASFSLNDFPPEIKNVFFDPEAMRKFKEETDNNEDTLF